MAVPKAKKKKKSKAKQPPRDTKERWDLIRISNYVTLAIVLRVLWTVYDWRHKRIAYFLEAYMSLLAESHKFGVWKLIRETKELTGIDVKELIDGVYEDKA